MSQEGACLMNTFRRLKHSLAATSAYWSVIIISLTLLLGSASAQILQDLCWTHNSAEGQGFATALDACRDAVKDYQGNEYARIDPNNNLPGNKHCYAQQAANDNNLNDDFHVTVVYEQQIQPHCLNEVCGPYGNISDSYYTKVAVQTKNGTYIIHTAATELRRRGADYTGGQRSKIIKQNKGGGNVIVSDLLNAPVEFSEYAPDLSPPCTTLKYNPPNPPPGYRPVSTSDPCYVNIHHVIPRLDENSCPCGRNSYKNALVIPRQLNNKLSNTPRSDEFRAYVASIQAPRCLQPQLAPRRVPAGARPVSRSGRQ
jgi:hypothetical protein